ncbi:putative multidrug resistance protein [Escherichia coli]|uniref:Putative multidrug resistance protein n=1 Tax=Escherichia coli TaxID=562 RepID=A0A376W6X8_ECOLX|nr:putative multidrug resistance protein [Escherichia coli]
MAVLTLALDGSKGTGFSPLAIAGLVAVGVVALVLYLLHAQNNNRALFSLKLFPHSYLFAGPGGELCRTYWQWHVALYDTGFPANWSRFLAVSCRTDDDPDGTRQHGNEANCGTGSESLWLSLGTGGDPRWACRWSPCCL